MPPPPMDMLSSRRQFKAEAMSQQLRDMTDDRYRDLRKPRTVRFYCNGDRYFRGKKLLITPHRYLSFNDLLGDLTGKLPTSTALPYGVRQIYTLFTGRPDSPRTGRPVHDIEELQDGGAYVCAGFEKYKPVKYGKEELRNWMVAGRPHNHNELPPISTELGETPSNVYGHGAFAPGKQLRHSYPKRGMPSYGYLGNNAANKNSYMIHADLSPIKPKVITVVRNGGKPRTNVKILLNKRSVQSFEQLMSDIAESFGPKWKNDKIKKLYTLRGREVQGVSDFFRDDDVFIGSGQESLTSTDVQEIIEEVYPDSSLSKGLLRHWDKQRKKRPVVKYTLAAPTTNSSLGEESKRDSGYGDSDDKDEDIVEIIIKKADRPPDHKKNKNNAGGDPQQRRNNDPQQRQQELQWRLDREREKEERENRERKRKRMEKRLADERRALEEERRKRDLALSQKEDPFKKIDAQREAEKRKKIAEERRRKEEEEQRLREEDERQQREMEEELERLKREREELERNAQNDRRQTIERASHDRLDPGPAPDRLDPGPAPDTGANSQEVVDDGTGNGNSGVQSRNSKGDPDRINGNQNAGSPTKEIGKVKKKKTSLRFKLGRQVTVADTVYDKYEAGKTLGDGNFAVVKGSILRKTGGEYAMKIIDKSKLKGKEHMIESEIEIMKNCSHPNIVKLYEEYETNAEIFLIMEIIKGGDLFDAITQSVKFNESGAASMCKDVTNALFYLHSRHIIHRDLKPENLMVCRNKDNSITLKLGDFGLAMDVRDPIYTVCGTPTYVAPEILTEIGYGLEVDMWALGVITYILLCGFPPFRSPDRNQTELFEFIKSGEFEFLSPYWDGISSSARDLIEKLLIVNKKKRYTAVDALCHPWLITCGGSIPPPDNMAEYRENLRQELNATAASNNESYQTWRKGRTARQKEP